jgi:hypothetical protein
MLLIVAAQMYQLDIIWIQRDAIIIDVFLVKFYDMVRNAVIFLIYRFPAFLAEQNAIAVCSLQSEHIDQIAEFVRLIKSVKVKH